MATAKMARHQTAQDHARQLGRQPRSEWHPDHAAQDQQQRQHDVDRAEGRRLQESDNLATTEQELFGSSRSR